MIGHLGHFLLDTRDLKTYPKTYSGHFVIYHFLRFQGYFSTFKKMGALRKSKFSDEGVIITPLIGLVLGG